MDFIEGLPKIGTSDTILVVVDQLNKYTHFVALKHPFSATTIARLVVKETIHLHGVYYNMTLLLATVTSCADID